MKIQNPDKYNYILSLDKNLEQAIYKYKQEYFEVLEQAQNIYYELKDSHEIVKFSRYLYKCKIYNNQLAYASVVNVYPFSISTRHLPNFNAMKKYALINRKYKTWKRDNI
jgi:hypothetical protein